MKLFAQHGAQAGPKVDEGIARGLLDGVVFGPRNISLANLKTELTRLKKEHPTFTRLVDPQFYACFAAAGADASLGYLEEEYDSYFGPKTRRQLEREPEVLGVLEECLKLQQSLDVSAIVAPNIVIPRSFNSIEAVIAKNFIRNAAPIYGKMKGKRKIYATLAIQRDALIDKQELTEFLNEITVLETPPTGFYLLIAASSSEARGEICHPDTLSAWMLINHALKINGFEVINGFSDVYTPMLGAVGADAGCSGWFSNLRTFSLARFGPPGGGRLPTPRYLSKGLLNRVTYFELNAIRERFPAILNGLPTDELYPDTEGSEPQRNQEVLQSWEAIKSLSNDVAKGNPARSIAAYSAALDDAEELYSKIARANLPLEAKSGPGHLEPISESLRLFTRAAEIELPE